MSLLSKQYHSVIIDDKNTWDDWHLIPSSRPVVVPPELEENYVKVPGRDGFVDINGLIFERPTYGKRAGSWEFIVHPDYAETEPWDVKYSRLLAFLHGKTHTVVLEDDPGRYYEGILKVNAWKPGDSWSTVTIDYVLQPYKHSDRAVLGSDWLWDPFDFMNDVISCYDDIVVTGVKEVVVIGNVESVVPTITAAIDSGNSLAVQVNGQEYTLSNGENVISDIIVGPGETSFIFIGNGVVSIVAEGGWL